MSFISHDVHYILSQKIQLYKYLSKIMEVLSNQNSDVVTVEGQLFLNRTVPVLIPLNALH